MKDKKIVVSRAFESRAEADEYATMMRTPVPGKKGGSVRIFPRTIRAGGAYIDVFAVVVYEKELP